MGKNDKIRLKHWRLPHRDSRRYLQSVIRSLELSWEYGPERDWEYDAESPDPDWHRVFSRYQGWGLNGVKPSYGVPEGKWKFDHELDWDYEKDLDAGSDEAERSDLFARAHQALAETDIDEVLSLLDELLAEDHDEPTRERVLKKAELWGGVIDGDSTPPPDPKERVRIAISELCDRLCRLVAEDARALWHIEWRELERMVAFVMEKLGFKVQIGPGSKDGGKDVVVWCEASSSTGTYYIEVKHWRSGKLVSSKQVFYFTEVVASAKADGGLYLSTSGYGADVISCIGEVTRQKVRLGEKEKVVSLCQTFVRRDQGLWSPRITLPEVLFSKTL